MDIYILRHGIAGDRAEWKGDDRKRPLTKEGKTKMRLIAAGMRRMDMSFDRVLTSPYARAAQTAKIVTKALKATKDLQTTPALGATGDPRKVLEILRAHQEQWESVLLIGHEPYLSRFISVLITGQSHAGLTLRKGGLCRLKAKDLQYGRCATIEWLLAPRVFEQL